MAEPSADGRTDSRQNRQIGWQFQQPEQQKGQNQGGGDGGDNDRQRLQACFCNDGEIKAKSKQNHCILQNFF